MLTSTMLSTFIIVIVVKSLPSCSLPVSGHNSMRKRTLEELREDEYQPEDWLNWNLPQLMGYKDRFEKFMDSDRNGRANFAEVKNFLRKYSPDVSNAAVKKFISRRDSNGDHEIEFVPEYIVHMSLPVNDPEAAKEWFALDDRNHDGRVTRDELLVISRNLGLSPPEVRDVVDGYYMNFDMNGDKILDWKEYLRIYTA